MLTIQFLIEGRVQGVGYRRFVQKQAMDLNLPGWTRNLQDGRVEVITNGPPEVLQELENRLRKGPLFSSVKDVTKKPISDELKPGFEIRADADGPLER